MTPTAGELLVAGGGVAGVCAAVAAARRGIRTILVEQQDYLGGIGYAGLLPQICGLYLNGPTLPTETLNDGLTREIVGRLQAMAPQRSVQRLGQVYVLPYAVNDLQELFSALLAAEAGVTVLRNHRVIGVDTVDGNIRGVRIGDATGAEQTITAAAYLDCTGTGELASLAGGTFALSAPEERQLAGFSLRLTGLVGADETLAIKVPYYCARAVSEQTLPPTLKFTTYSPGDRPDEAFLKLSLDGEARPGREQQARGNAHALLAYLGQVLPAFRGATIAATSLQVQEREGRRICGDYLLTEADLLSARKFPDGIVKNAWPIELWDRRTGTRYQYLPPGEYYEIPFRCLTVKGIANLLTAGRCISVTAAALGSTRVMGTCMALGEQAGLAASRYVREGRYGVSWKV